MHTRRKFLKCSAAGAVVALTSKPAIAKAAKASTLNWRLALGVPKTLPIWGTGVEQLCQRIAKLTKNHLNIRVYGAGELVPALATFDAVKSGSVEMGHSAGYYWQGKIPASPFFCALPFGMEASCANAWLAAEGLSLWHELMQPYGVISFPCGSTGRQCLGWYRKPLSSPDDLIGLKVRIPGLAGKVFAAAGASPVLLPGSELFTSLATGVIDAVEWVGPYHDSLMGFSKAVNYYYGSGWHEPNAVLELMINQEAWDSLGPELQEICKFAISETDAWMRIQWEYQNALFFRKLQAEPQLQLLKIPDSVLQVLRKASEQVIAEIVSSSPLAERIGKSYFEFKKSFEAYQSWSAY